MMKLWICVPGGDDDRERVVLETNDIDEMDAAIDRFWEEEVMLNDEYFWIEGDRHTDCFNTPDEWYDNFREKYIPETLARYLGRIFLP